MVLFGPAARSQLLPFPADVRWPGWGIETEWSRQERLGLRVGIVDGVTMVHLQPVNASGYAVAAAREQEQELRRRAGFAPGEELQYEREHWRPWRRGTSTVRSGRALR
jgi:hypothetical protein